MKNYAGKECNEELIIELEEAGIPVVVHEDNVRSEPITNVTGLLHGWRFCRAHDCWVAMGPAVPTAMEEEFDSNIDGCSSCGMATPDGATFFCITTQSGLNALCSGLKLCNSIGLFRGMGCD